MFKKPTKKQFLIRRILLSVLATFSVVTIVTVTILSMLGFRLDSGNGRLEAIEIDVSTKTVSRIREILVSEGDFVDAGQLLTRMDTAAS